MAPVSGLLSSMGKEGADERGRGPPGADGGRLFNRALVFGRDGELIGFSDKMHPVGSEALAGVCQGEHPGTSTWIRQDRFTHLLRLNWPGLWTELASAKWTSPAGCQRMTEGSPCEATRGCTGTDCFVGAVLPCTVV